MKAVIYKPGNIPRHADFQDPQPKERQELIMVKGASIKTLDRMLIKGSHYSNHYKAFPAIAGVDGVVNVGAALFQKQFPLQASI